MKRSIPVVVAVLGLLVSACGGSSDESADDTTASSGPAPTIDDADDALTPSDSAPGAEPDADDGDGTASIAESEPGLPTSTVGATVAPIQTDRPADGDVVTSGDGSSPGDSAPATTAASTTASTAVATTTATTAAPAATTPPTTVAPSPVGSVPTAPLGPREVDITIAGVDFGFTADVCEVGDDLMVVSGIGTLADGTEFVAGIGYDFFGGTLAQPDEMFFELIVEVEPPLVDDLGDSPQYYASKIVEPDFTSGEAITVQFDGSRLAGFGPVQDFSGVSAPADEDQPMTFAAQC